MFSQGMIKGRFRTIAATFALSLSLILIGAMPTFAEEGCHDRMTGGGTFIAAQDGKTKITYGFELHCDESERPNNLEINWQGNQFHLETISNVSCVLDANVTGPQPPVASINTLYLTGTGRYNGQSGFTISVTLVDAGEPGKRDTATFVITDQFGNYILRVTGTLTVGNNQAHRATGQ
jgi:hypothetical protein